MIHPAVFLRILALLVLSMIVMGPGRAAAQSGCEAMRRSCIAECRARHFSIDPKRDACIEGCIAQANRCARERGARQGGLVPSRCLA